MSDVLFRLDFGREIGLGHLRRSLSLATALAKWGVTGFFLTGGRSEYSAPCTFEGEAICDLESWTADDAKATLEVARRRRCKAIVVDSHEVRARYLAEIRAGGLFVIARDDLASEPFPCQIVINGNANARELSYQSSSGDTRFLLGPEYAVLPPEFWEATSRAIRDISRDLLIILGGADPCHLMPQVLALLDEVPGDFTATAVVGPFFENVDEVQAAAAHAKRHMRVVYDPRSVRDLMLESDLAISAAGQTLYELARAGCPAVAVRTAANQDGQLKALARAGVAQDAGSAADARMIAAIGNSVLSLLGDRNTRTAMSAAGQRLIDGQGALRVAQAIAEEIAR